jgi:hypothetical protein
LDDDFSKVIKTWKLSRTYNKNLEKQESLIQFLNLLNDKHKKILSNYFNDGVDVERISKNLTYDDKVSIDDLSDYFTENKFPTRDFAMYRNKEQVFLTFWR